MKELKKRKFLLFGLVLCFLVSIFIGMFSAMSTNLSAFADAETDYSNLSFSLINGNEYRVKAANRQITQAIIPATYNEYPVTEIMDNAFLSCSALEEVIIPESVKKIGTNAFYNCKNLKSLRGMSAVETIATNAFASCTNIRNLIIPASVKTMGSSVIKNVENPVYVRIPEEEMTKFPSSWSSGYLGEIKYGNELTYSPVEVSTYSSSSTEIHYSVESYQNLNCPDEDVIIKCSVQEEDGTFSKVDNFEINAFDGTNVKSLTIQYDKENVGTDYTVNISSCAFLGVQANSISIEVDITLNEDIYGGEDSSSSVFALSTISSVTLPASINRITGSMFLSCINLEEIRWFNSDIEINHLDNIEYIDDMAFYECTALNNLYIPNTINYIGYAAFGCWGTTDSKQTIHIDLYTPNENEWDIDWDSEVLSTVVIEYKEMSIELEKNGGVNGSNYFTIRYGQELPQNLTAPDERVGYTFNGYYALKDNEEFYYYNANMESNETWYETEPIILYAKWTPKTYDVTFDFQDGEGGTEEIVATYEQAMPTENVNMPTRTGYNFDGYYTQPNGAGTQYYNDKMASANNWDIPEDTILYSNWIKKEYTVIFEKVGGTGGTTYTKVTYDMPLPDITKPTKVGYDFRGYYSEAGTKYYDENAVPVFELWNFDSEEEIIILTARWTEKEYFVTFDNQDGSELTTIEGKYNEPMPATYAPTRLGYTFGGYYINPECTGAPYYNSDMSSARDWDMDESFTVYAKWTVIIYSINYVGVSKANNPNPQTYTVEDEIIFADPTNCDYLVGCDWLPASIPLGSTENVTVTATYRERHLWENKEVVEGVESYLIYTAKQFLEVKNIDEEYSVEGCFYLMADINLIEYANPCLDKWFDGKFYGQNHTISGIRIDLVKEEPYYGLFNMNDGYIGDLIVRGTMSLQGKSGMFAGLLCGFNEGTIYNCKVYGESEQNANQDYDIIFDSQLGSVGGIVGDSFSGTVVQCANYASIYSCGDNVGGIAGEVSQLGTFTENVNYGNIYCFLLGWKTPSVGGIVGYVRFSTINNCINNGNIYLIHDDDPWKSYVGHLIGRVRTLTSAITGCESNGIIDTGDLPDDLKEHIGGDIGYGS